VPGQEFLAHLDHGAVDLDHGDVLDAGMLATSRSMPPSPPPMISTRLAAPWARIGTWVSIS
jgi:hypothetical protein